MALKWLMPWLLSHMFGYNFYYLAKVLATSNPEPGLALHYILVIYFYILLIMYNKCGKLKSTNSCS